ncbi:MAG: response regulator, partial [Caulobacterales bacterium]|nr:response regulator [Caulobacterales bacterium]
HANTILEEVMPNVPVCELPIIKNAIQKTRETGQNQTIEHSIIDSNNNKLMLRVTFSRILAGKNEKIISISSDITNEIKRREELEKALEASNRANRAKSEFLANMSHEIRTPLNGVIAIAGLLGKTNLDTHQKEMVDLVENSGDTLKCLLNDILDLARVESGKLEIEETNFNLKEALNSVSSLFAFKAEEKGINFVCQIDDNLDNEYLGDPTRIKQIISNFLSNATKFTQKGQVSLNAKLLNKSKNRTKLVIEVQDTGMGISKDDIASLFERFEQIDGSITREHGGSGLGLSISKALAKLMKGDIKVTSKIGKGSKFALIISLKNVAVINRACEKSIEQNIISNNTQNIRILAADDNVTNRRILELVLAPIGVELTLCENGQEAIDNFKTKEFDLILMDLQMPVLDGLSAIKIIREMETKSKHFNIPIIAISANAMAHQIDEAIKAGANRHIAKPFSPEGLINGIDEALENVTFEISSKAA